MAYRDLAENRCSEGTNHPRAIGEGTKIGATAIFTPRRHCGRTSEPVHPERLLQQVKAIADTGFLVAFASRRDQHHTWAKNLAVQVTEPLLTCDAVLAETAFHLRNSALVLAFIADGLVRPAFAVSDHLDRLTELAERYADREPDLADLCLIRLSEVHPRHPVITTDLADFRVYRRGRREAIPLIHPES